MEFERRIQEDADRPPCFHSRVVTRTQMLERFLARDAAWDGRFYTGVVTTGIYCLCSCPAKKPKPDNVRFFANEDLARAAGLRPCKRCRPDLFARGRDPEREGMEQLRAEMRNAPGDFASVGAVAARSGWKATRLGELFRRHFHDTVAGTLLAARVDHAAHALVETPRRIADIALDAGFESSSAFHDGFKRLLGTTPKAWRDGVAAGATRFALPADFRWDAARGYLGRDPESPAEALVVHGPQHLEFAKAIELAIAGQPSRPVRLELRLTRGQCEVRTAARGALPPAAHAAAHRIAQGLLGLPYDPGPFERRARRTALGRALVRGGAGLRMARTATVSEALTWAILGQQVNLAFAHQCRREVIRRYGRKAPDGMTAHPSPTALADVDAAELRAMKISGSKARFIAQTHQAMAAGALAGLEHGSAVAVEQRLLALHGIGPWTANYVMMRGYGFADCVPVGDAGLVAGLKNLHGLDKRPGPDETRALMRPFAPHRTVACGHVWRSLSAGQDQ